MAAYTIGKNGLIVPQDYAEPIPARPEMDRIATSLDGRDITLGYVNALPLLPPTDTVLQARGGGDYRIYEEILRDDQVQATFQQRRLAVVSSEWEVVPGGKRRIDQAAADFLSEQLDRIRFDAVTDKMLFGVFYGYAVAEILWARDGRFVVADRINVVNPRRFGFTPEGELRLLTMEKPDGEPLPPAKFWHFSTGHWHDDDPYGLGLGHWLYWPVWFKRNGIKFWLIFLEKFGMPTALGKYPAGTTEAEKQRLLEALKAIQNDAAIRIPDGMQIELIEAGRSGSADYDVLVTRMDAAIAKVVLGQTMTTDNGSSRAQAQVHLKVRQDLVKADADLVCNSFNLTVARWLTAWNFPGANPPKVWRRIEEEPDLKAKADTYKTIFDMGFKPRLTMIEDEFGGEWEGRQTSPSTPADGQNSAAPPPAAWQFAENPQRPPHPADMQAQTLATLADAEVAKMIDQIRVMLEKASGLEQFKEMLLAAYGDLDSGGLVEAIGQAMAASHLAGRYDLAKGSGLLDGEN